jgi:spermidine synthase
MPETLYELPCPFDIETGTLWLLEPPDSDPDMLRQALLQGTYDKPFLIEHDDLRTLYFSLGLVQSTMRISQPDALDLTYTRKMMAFLPFYPRPKGILLLGLGGGSIAKFCYRHLPRTELTAVEINPHVVAFRKAFCIPDDDGRFRIHCADAARFITTHHARTDVILVDAFDGLGIAPELANPGFYAEAYNRLSANGILVMNLAGDKAGFGDPLAQLAHVFDDRVLSLKVRDGGNQIAFAFKNPAFPPRWDAVHTTARDLEKKLGLAFSRYVERLEKSEQRGGFQTGHRHRPR